MKINNPGLIIHLAPAINFIKNNCRILIALFFTIFGFYLRFKQLAGRQLWTDELWQLEKTIGPFKPIWQRLIVTDFTSFPGAYLLNYPFVKFFGTNKWAINIPNYFITFFGFYFLYLICQKYLKTFWGYLIAFLIICINPHLIFHSFEFRPYAVLPTLSLASFYFAGMVISERQLPMLKKILIGTFFIFVIIYHVFGLMIVGLCLLYFIIIEANKSSYKEVIKGLLPFLLPAGFLGFLLFIWFTSGTIWEEVQKGNWQTFDYYPDPVNDFVHFIRQVSFNLMAQKHYGQKHLALGIWIILLFPHKDRLKQAGFFLLMILLPIVLILALAIYEKYWFLDRQLIWIMPLYAFFLAWCWDSIIIFIGEKAKDGSLRKLIPGRRRIGSK